VSTARAILSLIGNTPLAPIRHSIPGVEVYAKLEYFNPSGSVKDRAVKGMVEHALAKDLLDGRILIEATSGNTGIAFAVVGAALQIGVHIFMPENASLERKRLLATLGATVTYTDPLEGTDGAQREAERLAEAEPERYYYPDQYSNPANWQAHYRGTGPEIWEQSRRRVTHFVAGLGTAGTFVGTSRFLIDQGVRCSAVQPDTPLHGLEGWKHMSSARIPPIYDAELCADPIEISTPEAYDYAVAAGQYLGMMLSPSSAANLSAALRVARQAGSGSVVVTVFPDNSLKYLTDEFWDHHGQRLSDPFA
jgi:cysteine synthase B